jgi:16S rRNA (guanine966-N2)-methyltransferase
MSRHPAIHVASGTFRGRRLHYPKPGILRPTMQRTREAVFDSLGTGLVGAGFVDLFSGAGAMGIEALSRGAAFARFVENAPEVLDCLEENLRMLGLGPPRSLVHRGEAAAFIAAGGLDEPGVSVVFADPPYDDDVESMLALVDAKSYPRVRYLIVEHRAERVGAGLRYWHSERSRRYGATRVTYFTPIEGGAP